MICSFLYLVCVAPTALWNINTLTHGVPWANLRARLAALGFIVAPPADGNADKPE